MESSRASFFHPRDLVVRPAPIVPAESSSHSRPAERWPMSTSADLLRIHGISAAVPDGEGVEPEHLSDGEQSSPALPSIHSPRRFQLDALEPINNSLLRAMSLVGRTYRTYKHTILGALVLVYNHVQCRQGRHATFATGAAISSRTKQAGHPCRAATPGDHWLTAYANVVLCTEHVQIGFAPRDARVQDQS